MRRSLTSATLALAAALLATPLLAAAEPAPGGGWHHHEDGMAMLHGIDLSSTQKDQIRSILESAHQAGHQAGGRMHATHEQLTQALLAGQTTDQMKPLLAQEESLRAQEDEQRLAVAVQIRGVLTAAQLSQAAATHAKIEALHDQEHALMDHP